MLLLIVWFCRGALGEVRPYTQCLSWPCTVVVEVKCKCKDWVRKLQWLWVAEWPGLVIYLYVKNAFFCTRANSSERVLGLAPSSCVNVRTQSWWIHINSLFSELYTSLGGWGFVFLLSRTRGLWRGKWRASPGFSLPEWGSYIQNFPCFSSSLLKCGCMEGWTSSEKLVVACSVAGKWKRFYSWDDISVLVWKKQRIFKSPWAPIKCLIFLYTS